MTPWTDSYAKFFSLHVFAVKGVLTTDEVDEIVIDMMGLMDRVARYEHEEMAKLYRILLPAMPMLRAKAGTDTADRLLKLENIMLDIVNLSNSVKK